MIKLFFYCLTISLLPACAVQTSQTHLSSGPSRRGVLMVFMDGTNNEPEIIPHKNTHVVTSYRLADTGIRSFYIAGVGSNTSPSGLVKGTGTTIRVTKAYLFLSQYYKPGDSICLFGFSRGANQCRILSNLISTAGLLELDNIKNAATKRKLVRRVYKKYRQPLSASERKRAVGDYIRSWNNKRTAQITTDTAVKIELMALWETVEAFRIDRKELTSPSNNHLNQVRNIKKAYHALSLDDNRAYTYTPVLMTTTDVEVNPDTDTNKTIEEVWFNGSHRDVGGGNRKDPYIQNLSLNWMLAKVKPYKLLRDTTIINYVYANTHNMRQSVAFRYAFVDTIRSIGRYLQQMRPAYNNGKLKLHYSVIARLAEGELQDFKTRNGRPDWYDTETFSKCFEPRGRKRILLPGCDCIEVVYD